MYLVLGSAADASVPWAVAGLRERGLEPLEWVEPQALAAALGWEHRVGDDGAHVHVDLADGRTIRGGEVTGVLNRLVAPPSSRGAHPDDRDYAGQEWAAFYLSWLHALAAPMLGRPAPYALCGAWRHASEWALLAARAGLATRGYRQSSEQANAAVPVAVDGAARTVYVVRGMVVGDVPAEVAEGCRRLAELAEATLLGVTLRGDGDGGWVCESATPFPDLTAGGGALLDALAHALRDGRDA